jgi:ADP-heptose:LPS heptosyltransferase
LYVGVDTGITHLASVLKAPSLVIAHNGASNWLPYYNENSIVIYQIKDDDSDVHEGRKYLESKRGGRMRYLDRVPMDVIKKRLHSLLGA